MQLGWTGVVSGQYDERPDGSSASRGRKPWREQASILLKGFGRLEALVLGFRSEDVNWKLRLDGHQKDFMEAIEWYCEQRGAKVEFASICCVA